MNGTLVESPEPEVVASRWMTVTSWVLMGLALFLVLYLHLVSGLIAGLLVYELVHLLAPIVERQLTHRWARVAALATLTTCIVGLLLAGMLAGLDFLKSDVINADVFSQKVSQILTDARQQLPAPVVESLPANVDDLKAYGADWVDQHGKELGTFGQDVFHFMFRGIIGLVVGAMLSIFELPPLSTLRPLPQQLALRAKCFADCFRQVVFAQVRISAINTTLTAIFLLIVFPAFGVHIPLAKTLLVVTFLTGLIPEVGNLVSNTLICIAALSVSFVACIGALFFLVFIHKLEYFLNARIIGSRIHARAWEMLIAMIVLDAAFGIGGLILAPIYYAYIKRELSAAGLI